MKFIFKPTLEHIALIKLVSVLWNQHDIRTLLEDFSKTAEFLQVDDYLPLHKLLRREIWAGEKEEKWQAVEARVIEKIPQDIMQISLKDKIIGYIKPIGLQVLRWMEYHRKCFCLNLKLPSEFCWTVQGIIDKKKTAEVLIKDENIDIMIRYKLACIYCLECDIPDLLGKIPENLKKIYPNTEDPTEASETAIVDFWEHFKKGNVHWDRKIIVRKPVFLENNYVEGLGSAAIMANKAATDYFLSKLHENRFLVQAALVVIEMISYFDMTISDPPIEYSAEVLLSLFRQMDDAQQLRIFQRNECKVIFPFLQWPCQTFFVEIASHLCRILPENYQILNTVTQSIVRKVKLGYKDYNYQRMYSEIWEQIPDDFKSGLISDGCLAGIVMLLLKIKDNKNIKLMFQNLSTIRRIELISSRTAVSTCTVIAEYEEWDLFKFFVQVNVISKDEMINFKEKLIERIPSASAKDKWKTYSQVLDDLVRGFDKRKNVDEDECSTAKKICHNNSMYEEKS